jgi:Na+-driven multidrug efflux pump
MKAVFTAKTLRSLGHNAASSWATIAMLALSFGMAGTGYLMTQKINKEFFEEVHEIFAYIFVFVAVSHIVGVILHTLKHKDNIGLSMIHGRKTEITGETGIEKSHPLVGLLFVILIAMFAFNLYKNYDASTKNLNLFGNSLQLGKVESEDDKD